MNIHKIKIQNIGEIIISMTNLVPVVDEPFKFKIEAAIVFILQDEIQHSNWESEAFGTTDVPNTGGALMRFIGDYLLQMGVTLSMYTSYGVQLWILNSLDDYWKGSIHGVFVLKNVNMHYELSYSDEITEVIQRIRANSLAAYQGLKNSQKEGRQDEQS